MGSRGDVSLAGRILSITTDFPRVARAFARATEEIVPAMGQALAEYAGSIEEVVVMSVRDNTPVDTGNLRDSTRGESEVTGQDLTIHIIQDATNRSGMYYGGYVDQGTSKMAARNYVQTSMDEVNDEIEGYLIFGAERILQRITAPIHD